MNSSTASSLVLSVLGDHAGDVSERTSVRVEGHDLSIGRAEHCDWVLQAQGVSRQHAFVRHLNGLYFLEDRSTNGMLLNGAPLRGGEPISLSDGDRLQLDTFEILVTVEMPTPDVAEATARRDRDETLQTLRVSRREPVVSEPVPLPFMAQSASPSLIPGVADAAGSLDPLAWLGSGLPSAHEASRDVESSARWSHASPMDGHFDAPQVEPRTVERQGPAVLPENWDRTRSVFTLPMTQERAALPDLGAPVLSEPISVAVAAVAAVAVQEANPAPAPAPAQVTAPTPSSQTQTQTQASIPVATNIESLFTLVLEGVMDVLRARAELKNGFRLPATLIQRRENNPLKFAPTGSEALSRVLAAPNEAFLSGEAAIIDAMDDIRLHQVALLAGVRAAFDDLIAQFDPSRFEEGESRRSRFGFAAAKGPWERYRAYFDGLAADPEERFRRLFGDEFARAYEDQLARAKRDGADRNRP
jgi:type VI secretion system protein ImpI